MYVFFFLLINFFFDFDLGRSITIRYVNGTNP